MNFLHRPTSFIGMRKMAYFGGKWAVRKKIVDVMQHDIRRCGRFYDLFCGSASVISAVDPSVVRIASDANPYVIALHQAMQRKEFVFPKKITEEHYRFARKNKDKLDPAYVGFIGGFVSFAGKWFGGVPRSRNIDSEGFRDYYNEGEVYVKKIHKTTNGVVFQNKAYQEYTSEEFKGSVVYLDPPYFQKHTGYINTKFNQNEFYDFCLKLNKIGAIVYISEYKLPKFLCAKELVKYRIDSLWKIG